MFNYLTEAHIICLAEVDIKAAKDESYCGVKNTPEPTNTGI